MPFTSKTETQSAQEFGRYLGFRERSLKWPDFCLLVSNRGFSFWRMKEPYAGRGTHAFHVKDGNPKRTRIRTLSWIS